MILCSEKPKINKRILLEEAIKFWLSCSKKVSGA